MVKLSAIPEWYTLSDEAKKEICNGCGAGNAKFDFVPDTIYGLDVSAVCDRHDVSYHFGKTDEDKRSGDREMRNNMLRLIDDRGGWLKQLRRWRANTYYTMVDKYGGPAFWDGKNVEA